MVDQIKSVCKKCCTTISIYIIVLYYLYRYTMDSFHFEDAHVMKDIFLNMILIA